jgi:hypothetical protein
LSGVDLSTLVAECEQFLRDTQAMWDDVYAETVRGKLAIDPAEATTTVWPGRIDGPSTTSATAR